jgi:hypothetical protein
MKHSSQAKKISSFSPFISEQSKIKMGVGAQQKKSTGDLRDLLILNRNVSSIGGCGEPHVVQSSLLEQGICIVANKENNNNCCLEGITSSFQANPVCEESVSGAIHNGSRLLPAWAMTDPNSIYRKLYNRNMDFFLWILEREQAPFVLKLHVQAKNKKDMNVPMVKRSIQALVSQKTIAEAG